jgi:hypothetical protein
MEWRFKTSSRPAYLDPAGTVDRLRQATSNITQANNICAIPDTISATSNYLGSTTQSVQMPNGTNDCNDNGNGTSIVAFGSLAGSYIGWACWWFDVIPPTPDNITESDVRLEAATSWTITPGGPCSGSYSLEGVMTHERGHSFGLAHVSEDSHEELTMSENVEGTCQNSESTLGLGDLNGLEALY